MCSGRFCETRASAALTNFKGFDMPNYFFGAFALFCLVVSLIPFIPIAHGAFRIFEFGRLQIATVSAIAIILIFSVLPINGYSLVYVAMLLLSLVVQLYYIARFTPFWKKQVALHQSEIHEGQAVSLLVCNVKQSNNRYEKLIKQIEKHEPDILLLMETDQAWIDIMKKSLGRYEFNLSCPQDNSYGMFLASKLNILKSEIKFLLNDGIPSFHCTFSLLDDHQFDLISIHPDPPVPHRDTIGRDAEILVVGKMAAKRQQPLIIAGDLNDVAWSATTRRFLRISRLLDPRQGRGMYNSFDARFPFLRWPLDHIFHSEDFELVSIKRLPFVGSDHFPMLYKLALVFKNNNDLPDNPTKEDHEEAKTLISSELNRDRKSVGDDWES
jgi:endonuclease/exonuclease/phosphatase (EEP) superfamily protein YafD